MLRALLFLLIRLFIVLVASLSLAHGADNPGLLDSLGKLLAPASAAPPPAVGNRTLSVSPAGQGRRIALVIGNGDYQYPDNLPRLANPTNDAQDIAEALRGFGFEVIERRNQTLEAMNQTIAEFGSRIGGSEAALFYFAGHGIQVKNQNYLMPVNARIDSEAAVPYQGVDLNRILDEMDNAKSSANIVMLDACRNNPISGKFRSGKSRGLASPGSAPKGTVIVYATDPGNVAADGDGRNGLFTAGLLTAFKGKDLSLDDVLTVASAEVERASGQTQTPYVNGPKTLQKNFNFRVTIDPGRGEIEKTFWTSIERSTDPADFEAYLRKYPKGSYRTLAENQIKRLKAGPPAATAPAAQTAVAPAPTFSAPIKSDDPETQFWNEVKSSGSREYLDAYLKKYPKGKYVTLARIDLKILDEQDKTLRAKEAAEKQQAIAHAQQEASRAEQAAWEQAKAASSSAAYAGYLERYPAGRYAELAQAAQQKLQREASELERQAAARAQPEKAEAIARAETELWRKAESAGNSATVQDYIERYPAGRHIAEARIKLAAVKKTEAEIPPGKFANPANPRIEMTTSQGSMIIDLYQDKAPKSVENFLQYAKDGFFDGTIFHRVIPGFMIQGGGFTPDMLQKDTRAPIQNEAKNGLKNETGTLSMARKAEPHSANAQFFINTNDNSALDYPSRDGWGYAVFGKVVQGMETVQKIARVPTGNSSGHQNVPTTPVLIQLVKPLTPAK